MLQNNIQSKFTPVYAPWFGVWESQIKIAKHCLYKTVQRARLTRDQLATELVEIANMMNNRPLTYVNSQLNDIKPLTPNMFIKIKNNSPNILFGRAEEDRNDPMWVPSLRYFT